MTFTTGNLEQAWDLASVLLPVREADFQPNASCDLCKVYYQTGNPKDRVEVYNKSKQFYVYKNDAVAWLVNYLE